MKVGAALVLSSKSKVNFIPIGIDETTGKRVTIKLTIKTGAVNFCKFKVF
jgi:hypothetical protein